VTPTGVRRILNNVQTGDLSSADVGDDTA